MPVTDSIAYVLAGGEGKRLKPLTEKRAKPAVPFGGSFRVIDFVLTNLYHSKYRKVVVPTQFRSRSLHRHIRFGWYQRFGDGANGYVMTEPAIKGGEDEHGWYTGTADAVAQHVEYIEKEEPENTLVFGGDHIYLMDISQFERVHNDAHADITISAKKVPRELAAESYGVLQVDRNKRVIGFEEKPRNPKPLPEEPDMCLASMGNYVFRSPVLLEKLAQDSEKTLVRGEDGDRLLAGNPEKYTKHDFGKDIIPQMLRENCWRMYAYDITTHLVPGAKEEERGYWRDVGDLDQYYEANMEIRSPNPTLNLYNKHWRIQTYLEFAAPAKHVHQGARVIDSIVANGVIVSDASVRNSVLSISEQMKIDGGAELDGCILLGDNYVGPGARLKRVIVDKEVRIPANAIVGFDREHDIARGFILSDGGVTVVPKGYLFK